MFLEWERGPGPTPAATMISSMPRPARIPLLLVVVVVACGVQAPGALPAPSPESPTVALPTLPSVPTLPPASTAASAPTVTAGPARTVGEITREGTAIASWMQDQVKNAIDGNPELSWNSTRPPPEWFGINYPRPYAMTRIELLTSQSPPGETVHEVWIGNGPDPILLARLGPAVTSDRQTLSVEINPPRVASRVVVRTLASPSHVFWRDIKVFGAAADASPPPVRVSLTPWLRGNVEMPTGIVSPKDGSGRLFLLEQRGRVRVVTPNGDLQNQAFLDIGGRVRCCTEGGLLGLAFPPGYTDKGYFYVSYTSAGGPSVPPGALVVSRFFITADFNRSDPSREEILLVVPMPPDAHNGGRMEFGPRDGWLYVGVGDGGPLGLTERRAQNLASHNGKILRIDPESNRPGYAVPSGNPFASTPNARPEIWALGLRNPWGLAFDWATGDLYLADSGETEWEETDYQAASSRGGENYGWPVLEGRQCFHAVSCDSSGLVLPVAEYHHVDGCAPAGGTIVRGSRYRQLLGAYVYGDFCSGRLWMARNAGAWSAALLTEAGFPITALGRDEAGNVYVADYNRGRVLLLEEQSQ